jgi:membrane fusion protein (multidrug efflux system)
MLTRIDPIQVHFEVGREFLAALFESKGAASDDCNSADDLLLDLVLPSGSLYPANGRVRSVEDPSKARNGTIRVVGEFPNPNGVLVPGMVARVRARFGKEF